MTDVYAASSVNVGLAIPDPKTLDLERAKDMANEIIRWSETCDDITVLEDARARTAAIETYFRHRHKDVATDLARATRQLQVRIGELLPQPDHGGDRKSDQGARVPLDPTDLSRHDARRFRLMAEHKDDPEVAAAIEEGMSQAEVLRRIERARAQHPDVTKKGQARVEKARELAEAGYTSRQIAQTIGINADGMGEFNKRHGIDVPADVTVGKPRRIDANRVIAEATSTLEGVALGLDLISPEDIDPEHLNDHLAPMGDALRQINKFHKSMRGVQR